MVRNTRFYFIFTTELFFDIIDIGLNENNNSFMNTYEDNFSFVTNIS